MPSNKNVFSDDIIMKMKFCMFFPAVMLFCSSAWLFAEPSADPRGEFTIDRWSRYGNVRVELDQIQFAPGKDIPIRFRVTNTGYHVLRIYPFREPWKSYQFMVLDSRDRELPVKFNESSYNRRENGEKEVVSLEGDRTKEIILHPGETLEKLIYLNDFYQFKAGEEYHIVGYFYPDARFPEPLSRSSNTTKLRIENRKEDLYLSRKEKSALVDHKINISPEETIYLFLSAEIRQNWKNYLKFLDLRKFITVYDRYASRYAMASDTERSTILREFSDYLTRSPADRLAKFKIIGGDRERGEDALPMENGRATVNVLAVRESGGYTVSYEYTYTLERGRDQEDGFWKIIHVSAKVVR